MSDYIPEDALVHILKSLPVKSLLRFRSVSKGWKLLIDSSKFVQDHLSLQKPRFFIDYGGRKYLVVDPLSHPLTHTLNKPILKKKFILVGTLHGVVCLLCDKSTILLWNPAMCKLSNTILLGPMYKWSWNNCYGFWIDPSTKGFKVLILQKWPAVECILYSSVRGDWSVIPAPGKLKDWKRCKEGAPVMVGGVAHWRGCFDEVGSDYDHDYNHHHKEPIILSFDFVQECFGFIEMSCPMSYYTAAPCSWQGKPSFLCWEDGCPNKCMLYTRQEDSWVKLFDFKVYGYMENAFWAIEDVEDKEKVKRKRKREIVEETSDDETEVNVRLLAIFETDTDAYDLILYGPKTDFKYLRRESVEHLIVNVGYDYVDSLLFP